MDQDTVRLMAAKIRHEMVCCDIYDKMMQAFQARGIEAYREIKRSANYHAICYYGEEAALLIEDQGRQAWRESAEVQEWVARVHEKDPRLGKPLERGCPPSCETDPKIHTGHYEPR